MAWISDQRRWFSRRNASISSGRTALAAAPAWIGLPFPVRVDTIVDDEFDVLEDLDDVDRSDECASLISLLLIKGGDPCKIKAVK